MPKPLDLKNSLNLPRTAFPMKAGLPQNEPKMLAEWEKNGLYARIQQTRAGSPTYVLHDGPPYPTGTIHLGTGLNKILKDMVVKSKTMAGFRAPFVPGWDCHGLPIETQVEKELGGKKGSVQPAEFRRICREFALRYVDQHRRDFKRLGVFGRWERPYLTMDPHHEASIAGAFLDFLEKGYVYRGLKPVYWCIHDRTALAEAEVEYEDHTSPSIWVRYPVVESANRPAKSSGGFYALVWTTTPWTLPASMALSFHPRFQYVLATDEKGDTYIVAEDLLGSVTRDTGLKFVEQSGPFAGSTFLRARFQHPFLNDRIVPGILGEHVTLEQGSGIVHTAPGHGAEDFLVGQIYDIETYAPLDDDGRFVEGLPEYQGKTVFEANPAVIALLKSRGNLVAESKLQHSYPHCWRCHQPVIFRATEQWFIHLGAGTAGVPAPKGPSLRQRALEIVDDPAATTWTPAWGRQRMRDMVAERSDWCISRQRFWGVPITVFYCEGCRALLDDAKALRHVLPFFEKEGADAWYTHSAEELLPPGTRCAKCGQTRWRKETDILDVWFDSGSTHLAVLDPPGTPAPELPWPADMYLEGPDQYRGWFQSSLLIGVGVHGRAPYKHVLTHGWTLDEQGRPMSKSLGNVVLPTEICEKWGADLLRLWVASQDYTADVRMSENVMTQLSEAYRKIRNTFRFVAGNLADFDPQRHALSDAQLWEIDRWMLSRAAELVAACRQRYEAFEFHRVFHALHDFCVVDLSAFYFDVLKDRLYTFAPASPGRRSAQTAVYRIASALLRLLAPIMVFTAEEIWQHLPRVANHTESIHLALFPSAEQMGTPVEPGVGDNWEKLLKLRRAVLVHLETARNSKVIGGSLEAKVRLNGAHPEAALWKKYAASLPALFIVSQVEIVTPGDPNRSAEVCLEIARADGAKCERCWNYSTHVGESADYPTVCERCVAALAEIERAAASASARDAGS
jgi:isoleucyl-tRNA synthetase